MNIWETINIFWVTLACNLFVKTVFIAVMLDTVLGLLRAIKEKKFNSCFGIADFPCLYALIYVADCSTTDCTTDGMSAIYSYSHKLPLLYGHILPLLVCVKIHLVFIAIVGDFVIHSV